MIGELTNHLWQSTLFAVVAGLLTVAFRKNRAQVRYWLWFSASIKFFVPFSLLMSLGSHLEWAPAAKTIAAPAVSLAVAQITEPFPETVSFVASAPSATDWKPAAMLAVWACGFGAIGLIRFRGWLRIRAAVCASTPIDIPATVEVRSSPGLLEPGVVGLLRPILLLPAGIAERLTPPQLEAVLAHELCHVRRRDNLFASIHMIVEATFWFHPLVWWIGARLVEERERACDEEVLSLGSEPHVYAEGIVNVCKFYVESPLVCVSGVTGSNLKKRIEAIMTNRIALRLNFAKKVALAVAGIAALAAPIVVGIMNAPAIRAQSAAAATPKFEVASIRPGCSAGPVVGTPKGEGKAGGKSSGSGALPSSPGRLNSCYSLELWIQMAYVFNADGFTPEQRSLMTAVPIEGGPAWIRSDRYTINAKAEGTPSREVVRGPMLRALLEDRFQLKVRRETRDVPAWALTVAKGGPKVEPFQGTCTPFEDLKGAPPAQGQKICGVGTLGKPPSGFGRDMPGSTPGDFSTWLFAVLNRPVIDRTGLTGRLNFHLYFTPDENTPGALRRLQIMREQRGGDPDDTPAPQASDPTGAPSIFTALQQQLGLKLEPVRGYRDFLVIDHVEKPSGN